MVRPVFVFAAVVALAATSSAVPYNTGTPPPPPPPSYNTGAQAPPPPQPQAPSPVPSWSQGTKEAWQHNGLAGDLGFWTAKTEASVDHVLADAKAAVHNARLAIHHLGHEAKETAEDAWFDAVETVEDVFGAACDAAHKAGKDLRHIVLDINAAIKLAIRKAGHAIGLVGKVLVGGLILTAEGLVYVTEKGVEEVCHIAHEVGHDVEIVLHRLSPAHIAEEIHDGVIAINDDIESFVHNFVCNFEAGEELVFPHIETKPYCRRHDGTYGEPIPNPQKGTPCKYSVAVYVNKQPVHVSTPTYT